MDNSYSESDISMSPTQILERLQMLRHLQLLQRGKLKRQQLRYDSADQSTTATEIVSHFSNSTSYNTFRTLLESHDDSKMSPGHNLSRVIPQDMIEGVSMLNLSQESEFVTNSPVSTVSGTTQPAIRIDLNKINNSNEKETLRNRISLDEMPILSPRNDFETLVVQKLQAEKAVENDNTKPECNLKSSESETNVVKKPYLKRGEGMSRFGIQKENFVIQNTKSLPWRKSRLEGKTKKSTKIKLSNPKNVPEMNFAGKKTQDNEIVHLKSSEICAKVNNKLENNIEQKSADPCMSSGQQKLSNLTEHTNDLNVNKSSLKLNESTSDVLKTKINVLAKKGKTWAAVLNKEQNDFLQQLKQSDYYKNFHSPAKSTVSDISCDNYNSKTQQEMEVAEQNLFDLIEKKVTNDSFNLGNSFFNRFLGKNIDTSGESTPLILKKCLSKNPKLTHISPGNIKSLRCDTSYSDIDNCNSECVECSETCSSTSSCCSCKTVTQNEFSQVLVSNTIPKAPDEKGPNTKEEKIQNSNTCPDDTVTKNEHNVNMEEMNAKLIATSDLLKDRLRELEDEIETFRKENANLTKIREELDVERQKFYEEKKEFEQKFNEEKILSEYYLAEEKEKLQKQKQIYERHVRDIRGRLNKKEKDEVLNLKKEIQDLKEEIRMKDAKSTSVIARLRNQIKLLEKEKKNLEVETEKLKKDNKRIQHSNEITRRLTNLKYLEKINKKLNNMNNRDREVDQDPDIKYKSYSIERQSRIKTTGLNNQNTRRPRAKSVPNLNVTSRYAKYFSQKDSLSDLGKHILVNTENVHSDSNECSDLEETGNSGHLQNNMSDSDEENKLEKIYIERFKDSLSTNMKKDVSAFPSPDSTENVNLSQNASDFFLSKSKGLTSNKPVTKNTIKSLRHGVENSSNSFSCNRVSNNNTYDKSIESLEGTQNCNLNIDTGEIKSRSTTPALSKHNSSPQGSSFNKDLYCDSRLIPSPEPMSNRSNTSKTNLNPTEIPKSDGSRELRFPNGNVKIISPDGRYSKFIYYNGDIKENFYKEGKIKYFYAETKTYHTSFADGLEVLEFPDGQIEKRYKDGSTEIRLPNGSIRYYDPKNVHVQEEWRFPDGATLTVSANGEKRIKFANGQIEVHSKDHKRREFPDGTVKLVYNDGTSETRYASGRIRIKDKHGNLIMDSAPD